jgi:hypothetical protein
MMNLNRPVAFAMMAALSVSLCGVAMAANFTDTATFWAKPAIDNLASYNLISGYQDATFKPDATITRAEFAAIVSKALKLNASGSVMTSFADVPSQHWASPAIDAAVKGGLMTGYPNGSFAPNANISRAEAIAVLVKAAKFAPVSQTQAQNIVDANGSVSNTPSWAVPAVAVALNQGVIGQAAPAISSLNSPTSRGEVAYMLNQLVTNPSDNAVKLAVNPSAAGNNPMMVMAPAPQMGQLVPSNTMMTAKLDTPLASNQAKVDDRVTLTLSENVMDAANKVLIPAGSKIMATVTKVSMAGNAGKTGMIELDFNRLVLPNDKAYTIDASLAKDADALAGDSNLMRSGKLLGKTAIGAGAGAALGTAIAPLSKGSIGKGAVYGAAIGTGVGAATALIQNGKEIQLPAGTPLVLTLNEPVRVDAGQ